MKWLLSNFIYALNSLLWEIRVTVNLRMNTQGVPSGGQPDVVRFTPKPKTKEALNVSPL